MPKNEEKEEIQGERVLVTELKRCLNYISQEFVKSAKGIPMVISCISFISYRIRFIIIIAFVLFCQPDLFPQINDTVQSKKTPIKVAGFPVVFYTPETRLAGGIYTHFIYTGSPENHLSYFGIFAGLSLNKQYTFSLLPELWWKKNVWHLNGELNWQYWPDKFFGLGNEINMKDEEYYISKIKGIKLDLSRRLISEIYAGFLIELEHNRIIEYDTVSYAQLPYGTIPGSKQSLISGIGLSLARDSRDIIFFPTDGAYYQVRLVYFSKIFGSTADYLKFVIDLRQYLTLGNNHVLYLQGYAKFQTGHDIPFRNLSLFGGDNLMRGYFRGSYRDNNIIVLQAEYHTPYIWRFGGVVFVGAGDVFGPYSDNSLSKIKPSAGFGLRFLFLKKEKLNLRIDYGFGRGDRGLYVNIQEAF